MGFQGFEGLGVLYPGPPLAPQARAAPILPTFSFSGIGGCSLWILPLPLAANLCWA